METSFKLWSVRLLRYALGLIYVWFGGLKVFGISPVEELVYRATHWSGFHDFSIFLGVWEVAIGLCLWIRRLNLFGFILLFLQFPGTFMPLLLNPEDCFTSFPFALTLEGQYIVKNIVLVCVGLVLIAHREKRST